MVLAAYKAYVRGDLAAMLAFVDEDLQWTYLDPTQDAPEPQVCRGRHELEVALTRQLGRGLRAELEEFIANGDRVVVVLHLPGLDVYRVHAANDRTFDVVTVRNGRIVALRGCHDRAEALGFARLR